MPRADRAASGGDIPPDPDSRVFRLVRSAFGESWDFGDICSRWYDGGGSCRTDTALTFTTLFVLLLPFASGMLVGVTTFARDFERSVWWFEDQYVSTTR